MTYRGSCVRRLFQTAAPASMKIRPPKACLSIYTPTRQSFRSRSVRAGKIPEAERRFVFSYQSPIKKTIVHTNNYIPATAKTQGGWPKYFFIFLR